MGSYSARNPTAIKSSAVHLTFRRLDPSASMPARAHPGDAGFDLTAIAPMRVEPGEMALVPTGIAIAIPEGHAGLVIPRSGLALRHGIGVVNAPGLIDSGYRGELAVILINHGLEPFSLAAGDRIAQLVIVAVPDISWDEVEELTDSTRGEGGFGSSGGFRDRSL